MEVKKFPRRFKNLINALSWIIYEISENNCQALQSILLNVEKGLWIGLNNLQEESHPGIECLIKAIINEFIVDSICPGNSPEAEIKYL